MGEVLSLVPLPPPCSYTEVDEHKIQHCFCYTSTVLTSTLAFQKEQKLKCECQVRGAWAGLCSCVVGRRLQQWPARLGAGPGPVCCGELTWLAVTGLCHCPL